MKTKRLVSIGLSILIGALVASSWDVLKAQVTGKCEIPKSMGTFHSALGQSDGGSHLVFVDDQGTIRFFNLDCIMFRQFTRK
jgi:hypothetical protein